MNPLRDALHIVFSPPGSFVSASDIDFYLDVDPATGTEMVIVSDTVHTRHHAEYLARHITKFEEIVRCVQMRESVNRQCPECGKGVILVHNRSPID